MIFYSCHLLKIELITFLNEVQFYQDLTKIMTKKYKEKKKKKDTKKKEENNEQEEKAKTTCNNTTTSTNTASNTQANTDEKKETKKLVNDKEKVGSFLNKRKTEKKKILNLYIIPKKKNLKI